LTYSVGVDLGQRRDHSAIVVVEYRHDREERRVLSVERVPLGTPYPAVVERVRQTLAFVKLRGSSQLTVDATGVGAPVVEMLNTGPLRMGAWAVTITGGENAKASNAKGRWNVPKRDLIARLQVLLERGQLRIAKGLATSESLRRECMDMRMEVSSAGRAKMGAEGAGEHDDLVIAMALACWRAAQGVNGFGGGRIV